MPLKGAASIAARFASGISRVEPWLYALYAGACTLAVARVFYGSMHQQLAATAGLAPAGLRQWSAPLDDVFIHFDLARATARGHPFQWSEGNGYSSGGTSLSYPFVLAFGYWVGFRQLRLMLWAGIVATVCVLATLLAARRLFRGLPRFAAWLAPPALLCVGALDWSLWSGMEVALLLALWGAGLHAAYDLVEPDAEAASGRRASLRRAWVLGIWCALLVATRPEAVVLCALFAGWGALAERRRAGGLASLGVLVGATSPALALLLGHALANLVFTGDTTAAGALVKLEIYHPRLTAAEVWQLWTVHLAYQVRRIAEYHMSDAVGFGWIPWGLSLLALCFEKTRRPALLLLLGAIGWTLLVAFNGQVRWQNERYAMPALAWLLLAAALGTAALLSGAAAWMQRRRAAHASSAVVAVALVGAFVWHELPRFREQVWFFGRASRNVRDQHLVAGSRLRAMNPPPHRVLVGDAGAIPYAADLPALDMIGLGGYHGLPFARATRWGVSAALELVERMPAGDRPDLMAIYPSWWERLPLWFGERVDEVPVTGNVICGGPIKVVYRVDWSPLDRGAAPTSLEPGERVVDAVDFADLVSEKQHGWTVTPPIAEVDMKLLPDPKNPKRDLWDAGRLVHAGSTERFVLRGLGTGRPLRLVVRSAPPARAEVLVTLDGQRAGRLVLDAADAWNEPSLVVPAARVKETLAVEFVSTDRDRMLFHLWAAQRP